MPVVWKYPPLAKATAAEVPAESSQPAPPPPPAATVKKSITKEKKLAAPGKITLQAVIKALILAKSEDKLSEAQIKQFETLVAKLKTKNGAAEAKAQMQTELRTMYRTKVYGK